MAGLVDADAQREARWDAVTATRVPAGTTFIWRS
jgi:hypothetical protein